MNEPSSSDSWSRFRFAVVAPLLAAPPARGELQGELGRLAEKVWQHPLSKDPVRFGRSTIERWYYTARSGDDPIGRLRRKARRDRGRRLAVGPELGDLIRRQHAAHPSWSYALHRDNLAALIAADEKLGPLPSYASVRRYMVGHGMERQRRRRGRKPRDGELRAHELAGQREVRSYEAEHVNALWHLDFHHGSQQIVDPDGRWLRPILLGILDDRSRLVCHAQWYLDETAGTLVHGLSQAFMKRGLPRSLLTDNGSAMIAAETTQGLERLSVLHPTTLPYSPHQNGKQEVLWAQVEGRLLAMLEGEPDLTLSLNRATQAWVEMEYNRKLHSEIGQTPLERWLAGPDVGRPCPTPDHLRLAFTAGHVRVQRRSDGTISVFSTRFEVPARFRHLSRLSIRVASWDLRCVWLVDEHTGTVLDRCTPIDRARNADGCRRRRAAPEPDQPVTDPPGIAPLLSKLMVDYAATGLPPAYLPPERREDR